QNVLSARTVLNFMEVDYGVAYSYNKLDDPKSRSLNLHFQKMPTSLSFTEEERRKDPSELIPLYNDDINEVIEDVIVSSIGTSTALSEDKNLTAYLDFKIPFKLGNLITGHVKTGGRYRKKDRVKDITSGGQHFGTNQFAGPEIANRLDWVQLDRNQHITAVGLPEGNIGSFLNGQYDFGSTFSIDRLNEISDAWEQTSQYWKDYAEANGGWGATLPNGSSMPSSEKSDYTYSISNSIMSDQNIVEHYYATYLLAEFKFGKWGMFMPGVRYEKTEATMDGFRANEPTLPSAISKEISGVETNASRSDEFFLPAIHLRVNPHKKFYIHGAYTQTLRRPNFNDISPNTYSAVRMTPPHTYNTKTPNLKAERWTNYDLQFTFHGEKAGLLSISGFYKTVEDKMWGRSWLRLPGEPLVGDFGDTDPVQISEPQNHEYPINLKGFEAEIQTSFWYLPKPFSYFTTSLNYTYTNSETQYPISWTEPVTVFPPGGGRPTVYLARTDTTISGRMTHQPKHIANASLGFNKGGLNIWLSYQYNGDILTGKRLNKSAVTQNGEMDGLKQSFQRWDLQVAYKFDGQLQGFEIMGNFANLTDNIEEQNLRGDVRPTYLENYGWTADLGIRYNF
ncbi:MAG: hypothetical protein GQ525_04190, partial [Draconibacterium sp.]|nr:hypothetical protein [Draconibacterium sp.]